MNFIPTKEAEKAAKEYARQFYNPNDTMDSDWYISDSALYSITKERYLEAIDHFNSKFNDEVKPVMEKAREALVLGLDAQQSLIHHFCCDSDRDLEKLEQLKSTLTQINKLLNQ